MTSKRKRRGGRAGVRRMVLGAFALGAAALAAWETWFLRLAELRDPRAERVIIVPTPRRARPLTIGPQNPYWTPIGAVSRTLVICVVSAEDARFFQHDGFDWNQVQDSLEADLEEGAYARGGSTITMQLARNLFLWRAKSMARKALEVYLTWRLEHTLSKQRILELYLNTAEWGPGIYGIGEASRHYYAKPPSSLTLGESAMHATILPSPLRWNPERAPQVAMRRQQALLSRLRSENAIEALSPAGPGRQ